MPDERLIYFDTSALAKWYLPEDQSDDVEKFIQANRPVAISSLTIVEMRSLLARRRRNREVDALNESRVFATFEDDVRRGHLVCHPVEDETIVAASSVLATLSDHAVRTLDALHLSIARALAATDLATADLVMVEAAKAMGFAVTRFD